MSLIIIYGTIFLISFGLSYVSTPLVIKFAIKNDLIDNPNKDDRRVHKKPVPRVGGLAMVFSMLISLILVFILSFVFKEIVLDLRMIGYLLGATVIATMGFIDDIKDIKAKYKFVFQMVAATIVYVFGISIIGVKIPFIYNHLIDFGVFAYPITVLWILGITNAVNLIDGLDGLAAGISSIAATSLLLIFIATGAPIEAIIITLILVGATLGFLPYNFNPAKTFMGDVGANFLGFTLATVAILGSAKGYTIFAIVAPIIVLGVPIFDMLFAIVRRLLKGQGIMTADKDHIHHRLLRSGLSHKQVVLALYIATSILGIIAVAIAKVAIWQIMLLILSIIAFVLAGWFNSKLKKLEPSRENSTKENKKENKE